MATTLPNHERSAVTASPAAAPRAATKPPLLLLFSSRTDGRSRRVEGFVAHVLQRRHNHESFRFRVVDREDRPDLFEKLEVRMVPTVMVVEDKKIKRRLSGDVRPHDLEDALTPWLH